MSVDLPPLADTTDYENLVGPPPIGLDMGMLLAAASDVIRSECGWHIAPVIDDQIVTGGPYAHLLFLPTLRLVELLSLTSDGDTVDLADVRWSDNGVLEGHWSHRRGSVTVNFRHGYDQVPAGMKALACAVAARAALSPTGITREQVGSVSVTYSQTAPGVAGGITLLEHEKSYLARYSLPPRP